MTSRACTIMFALAVGCCSLAPAALAQTSVQLFGPVDVRLSQTGASYTAPVTFNSATLNLSCGSSPSAMLSSTSDGAGKVLVDNILKVSNLTSGSGPTNVCSGGQIDSSGGIEYPDCFTVNYQVPAGAGLLNGADLDTYNKTVDGYPVKLSTGGVGPIDIHKSLVADETQQLEIDLQDEGGYVASSSIYLQTNCTVTGVNGNGTITGNPISSSNPTQNFDFNTNTDQLIGFTYDLSGAYTNQTITTTDQPIPQTTDSALTQTGFQTLAQGTSFATSSCLIHNGELLNGTKACKLFTLECTVGTGSTAGGAQCPVSSQANENFQDNFDGPKFTLPDIATSNGTFHEGMGFLMATEGWEEGNGGACAFDSSETELADKLCPLNILTGFSGPGTFVSSGQSTRPNSEFITVAGVPEDLTTVTPTDSEGNPVSLGPGNWTNNASQTFTLSSQPPNLEGTSVPNANNFSPAPIQSITWGVSPGTTPPPVGTTAASDTLLANPTACPAPGTPGPLTQLSFTPAGVQNLQGLLDGNYLIHYYATDCAGTRELLFTNTSSDGSGTWSTNYYTYPINIDTHAPSVATGPTLSPAGPYYQGESVTATFSCTDNSQDVNSGVISCGGQSFPVGTEDTGSVTVPVNTSGTGAQTFTVTAKDAAGNQSAPASVPYQVNVDSQIVLTLTSGSVTYPLGTNLEVQVTNINGHVPTGSVEILDNGAVLTTLSLKKGSVYYYVSNLSAGNHTLNAVYSGDKYNSSGTSAAVHLNVQPVPVTMSLACWNSPYAYGANFQCVVSTSSTAGAPQGYITYSLNGGASANLPLVSGSATVVITKPNVGNYSLVISYPAQTNYAAAGPQAVNFTVTPAPVYVNLTPSAWYVTGGSLTLTAAVQSSSAGAPNGIGSVTFTVPGNAPMTVPVNSSGVAVSPAILVSSLPNGNDSISATYSGTNYATSTTTISVQVTQP